MMRSLLHFFDDAFENETRNEHSQQFIQSYNYNNGSNVELSNTNNHYLFQSFSNAANNLLILIIVFITLQMDSTIVSALNSFNAMSYNIRIDGNISVSRNVYPLDPYMFYWTI
eukprot:18071_1